MGLLKRLKALSNNKKPNEMGRRKSLFSFLSPSDVTEGSLTVWRGLPPSIRHDPSMSSFQVEHNRLHGHSDDEDGSEDNEIAPLEENDGESLEEHSEFITIKVTNEHGEREMAENVCAVGKIDTPKCDESTKDGDKDEHITFAGSKAYRRYLKVSLLLIGWLIFAVILTSKKEKRLKMKHFAVQPAIVKNYYVPGPVESEKFLIFLEGTFTADSYGDNTTDSYLGIAVQRIDATLESNATFAMISGDAVNVVKEWRLPIVKPIMFDTSPINSKRRIFDVAPMPGVNGLKDSSLRVQMWTNVNETIAVKLGVDKTPVNMEEGVLYAALLLIVLYVLIIWEIVHRTFAAIIMSTMSIAVLAALDDRPTMAEIIQWIDVETLLLLFSMMIVVAILTETGIFDYLAVFTYKVTNGKIWPLIHCLSIITTLVSAFLDNVTTVLLMTPITIRLCEVMELNPVPVLMAIIVHANIGGTMTPVGDPPNIIITSNHYIAAHGVTFMSFTFHMAIGVALVMIQTFIHFRLKFRDVNQLRHHEPKAIKGLRREIAIWQRAAASLSSYSKDEDLVRETLLKKVKILQHTLKKMSSAGVVSTERYQATLHELEVAYPIKNKSLLMKSAVVGIFICCNFFVQSIPELHRLSLGWTALLGAILLLIISNKDDMDAIMARIEWTTLLFFAGMFIIMEALARMGLVNWIGKQTETVILSVSEDSRLAVAIIIVLWVSAITSAFVDSIPVTTMMVRVVVSLAENKALGLPLQPLVWALAFGPCLGGNGTLIGASANVVCAGIAEQHGYKITFIDYFKMCFPLMLGSVIVTTGYLMIAHVAFTWH